MMESKKLDTENKPEIISLDTSDWWVKVLAMLQHNWAVINDNNNGTVTAYFFHDGGTTKNSIAFHYRSVRDMIAIVDSIEFSSRSDAVERLLHNGFIRLADLPGPWHGNEPKGKVFDARSSEPGIYSKESYWIND